MCKGTCQKRCENEAVGIVCRMDQIAERTAQHTPAVKIPAGLRGSGKTPIIEHDLTDATFLGSAMIEIKDPREVAARIPVMAAECTAVKIPEGKATMEILTDKGWEQVGTVEGFQPLEEFKRGAPGLEMHGFAISGTIQLEQRSDMARACEIGSRLGKQIVAEQMGAEVFERLRSAVSGEGNTGYNLLKLVEAVGLRNWFDGDFVVLSMEDAENLAAYRGQDCVGFAPLYHAIEAAKAR